MNVQTFNNMSSWISAEPSLKNKVLLQAYYYRSESFGIKNFFLNTYFPDDFFVSLVYFFILFSFFISAISFRNFGFICFEFFIILFIFSFQSHALALAMFYCFSHVQLFSMSYITLDHYLSHHFLKIFVTSFNRSKPIFIILIMKIFFHYILQDFNRFRKQY